MISYLSDVYVTTIVYPRLDDYYLVFEKPTALSTASGSWAPVQFFFTGFRYTHSKAEGLRIHLHDESEITGFS